MNIDIKSAIGGAVLTAIAWLVSWYLRLNKEVPKNEIETISTDLDYLTEAISVAKVDALKLVSKHGREKATWEKHKTELLDYIQKLELELAKNEIKFPKNRSNEEANRGKKKGR